MGHLVNPLSFRLSITSYWKVNSLNYFNNNYKYSILYFYDKLLYTFLEWLFNYRWIAGFFLKRFKKKISVKKYVRKRLKKVCSKRRLSKNKFNFMIRRLWLYLYFFNPFFKKRKKKIKRRIAFRFKFKSRRRRRQKLKIFLKKLVFKNKKKYILFLRRRCRIVKLLFRRFFVFKAYRKRKHFRLFFFLKRYFLPELSHLVLYRSGFFSSKILLYFSNPVIFNVLAFKKLKKKLSWKYLLIKKKKFFLKILFLLSKFNNFFLFKTKILFFIKLFVILLFFFPILVKPLYKNLILKIKIFFFKLKKKILRINKYRLINLYRYNNLNSFNHYINLKRFFFSSFLRRLQVGRKLSILSNFSLFFVKNFFEKRWIFFLKTIVEKFFVNFKLSFVIYFISSNVMTSKMLFNFFCKHLRRKRPINRILNMILWDIKKQRMLVGFKILMAGRFTRKERALYKWIVHKQTPLSLYSSNLDYFSGFFKSRFGVSSFKIWIFKK